MRNPFATRLGRAIGRAFYRVLILVLFVTACMTFGGTVASLGGVTILNVCWIGTVVFALGSIFGHILYQTTHRDIELESLGRILALGGAIIFALSVIALSLIEVAMMLAGLVGWGWTFATLLALWVVPLTSEVIRGVLAVAIEAYGDFLMVVVVGKGGGISHRVRENGWGLFWPRGTMASIILGRHIDRLKMRLQFDYEGVPNPYRRLDGAWCVPPPAIQFIYEGVTNDHDLAQTIEVLTWLKPKKSDLDA